MQSHPRPSARSGCGEGGRLLGCCLGVTARRERPGPWGLKTVLQGVHEPVRACLGLLGIETTPPSQGPGQAQTTASPLKLPRPPVGR